MPAPVLSSPGNLTLATNPFAVYFLDQLFDQFHSFGQ